MAEHTGTRPWDEASRGATRASDAERESAVEVLTAGFCEGRLDREEYEERLEAAWRSRTYAELAALLRDLPRPAVAVPPFAAAAPRRSRDAGLAVTSLVCGLAGFALVAPIPVAIVLGHRVRRRAVRRDGSREAATALGAATVGLALGYLGAAFWLMLGIMLVQL